MTEFCTFKMALLRQLTRRLRLRERRWREVCGRRRQESAQKQMEEVSRKLREGILSTGEMAERANVPKHLLCFLESRFPQLRTVRRGGRRYYRPGDVELVRNIDHLLREGGYTIKGMQKLLSERGGQGNRI
jgi:hypothetical protein